EVKVTRTGGAPGTPTSTETVKLTGSGTSSTWDLTASPEQTLTVCARTIGVNTPASAWTSGAECAKAKNRVEPPPPPAAPVGVLGSDNKATFTWAAAARADSYEVWGSLNGATATRRATIAATAARS